MNCLSCDHYNDWAFLAMSQMSRSILYPRSYLLSAELSFDFATQDLEFPGNGHSAPLPSTAAYNER